MAHFWEIAKMVLPALLVLAMAWVVLRKMNSNSQTPSKELAEVEKLRQVLPLKIRAYERLIVMLERITPNSLVMRTSRSQSNVGQFQLELLKAIREEFEHNVGLQMYVSDRAWMAVVAARDETKQLIQVAASKADRNAPSITLSQEIFGLEEKVSNSAIESAKMILKDEVRRSF